MSEIDVLQVIELTDKVIKKADITKAPEPYTWAQIAERTILKYLFFGLIYHIGFVATVIYYSFKFHSVPVKWWTILWTIVTGFGPGLGVTAGAHRLWAHRAYKANLPLRVFLMILYSTTGVWIYPLYYWIRDHRLHHKYVDTDADPHNSRRGFFYCHYSWFFMERHPECLRRIREIEMKDIEADPVVMFQKRYSGILQLTCCFIIPSAIPVILWNETILNAILTQLFIRQVLVFNGICCVNSVAHRWGSRPYNKLIFPVENKYISLLTLGEGSHNYHHTFPWDYKTSEFPYVNFNSTTFFIHAMTRLGWAYDLRQPSSEVVDKVIRRIGYKSEIHDDY